MFFFFFISSSNEKKYIVRKKRVSKSEVKLVGDRKKKILSKDGRSCRVPNVTENRESVFGNVVLNGSISSLLNYTDGIFSPHNSGSYGRKLKHLRVQAYFLQPNLAKSRVTGEQFVGSVRIPLVPSARAQSKQKVGHRGEKRDSVSLLICRVFKTTGP